MAQETLQALLDSNKATSESWQPMPTIDDMRSFMGDRTLTVITNILYHEVTCADPRADPTHYLKLQPGQNPIMRNAGGRVTDDILTSCELLDSVVPIGQYIIIHHTDCGGLFLTDNDIRDALTKLKPDQADSIKGKTWNAYKDIGMDQSLRDDVDKLKNWKFLRPGTAISAYAFDIKTGQLKEVVGQTIEG